MIDAFEKTWEDLLHKVEHMDEATWNKTGRFMMNGQVRMEQPVSGFLWLFFFDDVVTIAVSSLPTFVRWAARCRRSTGRRVTTRRCSRSRTSGWRVSR